MPFGKGIKLMTPNKASKNLSKIQLAMIFGGFIRNVRINPPLNFSRLKILIFYLLAR